MCSLFLSGLYDWFANGDEMRMNGKFPLQLGLKILASFRGSRNQGAPVISVFMFDFTIQVSVLM